MIPTSPNRQTEPVSVRPGWAAAVVICIAAMTVATPVILSGYERGRAASDQNRFHLIAIRQFARQWPNFDFSDYASATTPGYHLMLAAVDRFISPDLRVLKFTGALFSIGLLATLGLAVERRAGFVATILLCLPFVCSIYFFSSMAWLLPDNAGWWGVLAVILLALRPKVDAGTYLGGAALLVALVLVRQSHLWVAVPLAAATYAGPGKSPRVSQELIRRRIVRVFPVVVSFLGAIGILFCFALRWHGLLPPSQVIIAGGMNIAGPAMVLAVTGMLGPFFAPLFLPELKRGSLRDAAWGALIGLIVGGGPESSYNLSAGRISGIWNAVRHAPVVFHRSPLFILAATLGGALIAVWLNLLPRRDRIIWATVVISFGATQLFMKFAFQRYDEPIVLMGAIVSAASFARRAPNWAWAGPMLLSATLAAITILSLG